VKRLRIPKSIPRDKLRNCPTGCTQKRTLNYWLSEKKSFDGIKCYNCGFEVNEKIKKPIFQKFSFSKQIR
jgi:Zn ribbon nucleic-acid-binding protein